MCYRCLVLVQNQTEALEYGQLCVNKRAKSALQSIVSQEQQHSQRIKTDIQDERIYTTVAVVHSTKVMTRRRN